MGCQFAQHVTCWVWFCLFIPFINFQRKQLQCFHCLVNINNWLIFSKITLQLIYYFVNVTGPNPYFDSFFKHQSILTVSVPFLRVYLFSQGDGLFKENKERNFYLEIIQTPIYQVVYNYFTSVFNVDIYFRKCKSLQRP